MIHQYLGLLIGQIAGLSFPFGIFSQHWDHVWRTQGCFQSGCCFCDPSTSKTRAWMLLGWFSSPFYCVLNLTPCRHCISVKFPQLCVRQDLGLFISPGADSAALCRSTSAVSNKYPWSFDHTNTKNYEDIKNPDVAAPVSQFLQHKPFHSVTFPYSWDEQQ